MEYCSNTYVINSRQEFDAYLNKNKKPFMATFYKETRKKLYFDVQR